MTGAKIHAPVFCSEALYSWCDMLTDQDREQLQEWGVTTGMLDLLKIPINKNLLSALTDIWNPELHLFQMKHYEMSITLEETQHICQTCKDAPLLAFHHQQDYQAIIMSIVDESLADSIRIFIDKSREPHLINLQALEKIIPNRTYLVGDTWLKSFLLRFVAEVFFGPGKPRADMAILAVVKEMIRHTTDISAIILANTFSAFDKCHYRSKHFTGCASLAQLWFAGHFDYRPYEPSLSPAGTYLKSPFKYQHGTKEAIHTAIMSTNEGEVKWNLMPVQHPSPVCLMIDRTQYKLMILPGLRGGIEYHPIRILK
jgi:hypothetical protein